MLLQSEFKTMTNSRRTDPHTFLRSDTNKIFYTINIKYKVLKWN